MSLLAATVARQCVYCTFQPGFLSIVRILRLPNIASLLLFDRLLYSSHHRSSRARKALQRPIHYSSRLFPARLLTAVGPRRAVGLEIAGLGIATTDDAPSDTGLFSWCVGTRALWVTSAHRSHALCYILWSIYRSRWKQLLDGSKLIVRVRSCKNVFEPSDDGCAMNHSTSSKTFSGVITWQLICKFYVSPSGFTFRKTSCPESVNQM